MTDISNTDDMIDSRDIIARIADLESPYDAENGLDNISDGERDELLALKTLAEEAENVCEWEDGETLVHDNYFTKYAEQYAYDIGALNGEPHWPLNRIDWEAAASDLRQDYSSVDFDGVTFWVRSS